MMTAWAVLGGFVLDAIFGDPAWLPHPVVYMGKAISRLEKFLRSRLPKTPQGELLGGAVVAFCLPVGTLLLTGLVCWGAAMLHPLLGLAVQMFWCGQALAAKGLMQESMNVYRELVKDDLPAARKAVSRIVGRDTEALTAEGVTKAAVEKGKSAFAGPELYRKTLGVIGLGAIGALVCNIALELGMDVYGYDPFLSVEAALRLDRHVHVVKNVDELYRVSDYITIHIPYNNSTKDFINAESIAKMKGQVRILNLARGGLVNDDDMIQALESGRVARYVTDFPDEKIAVAAHVVALPHLGASTPESEENCARMAADQLKDYLLNGNIKNSVNLPNVAQEWSGISRVCLIHQNIPAMLTKITSILSKEGVNVENLTNKSKKDYAYTMVDLNSRIKDKVAEELRAIPGMIRVRVLNH